MPWGLAWRDTLSPIEAVWVRIMRYAHRNVRTTAVTPLAHTRKFSVAYTLSLSRVLFNSLTDINVVERFTYPIPHCQNSDHNFPLEISNVHRYVPFKTIFP